MTGLPFVAAALAFGALSVNAAEPSRIVTLTPALAEMVWEIDGNVDRLVGVSEHSDFPAVVKAIPTVGPFHQVSVEAVARLKPDLVLASKDGNAEGAIQRLRAMQIPVTVVDTHSVDDWIQAYVLVGTSMNRREQAIEIQAGVQRQIAAIPKWPNGERAPWILFVVQNEPLMTIGSKTYLSESIARLGGVNLGDRAGTGYPRVSREWLVRMATELKREIVIVPLDPQPIGRRPPFWSRLKSTRVISIPADLLARPSQRLIEGLRLLRSKIP